MSLIKAKVEEINKIAQETRLKLNSKIINESAECLDKYQNICMNVDYYHLKSDFYIQVNDIKSAIGILKECAEMLPFNIATRVKLLNLYSSINDYDNFIKQFSLLYAYAYAKGNEELEKTIERCLFEFSKKIPLPAFKYLMAKLKTAPIDIIDSRVFPMSNSNESLIAQIIEDEKNQQWLVNNYRETVLMSREINCQFNSYLSWNTQTVKGMKIKGSLSLTAEPGEDSICFPVCTLTQNENDSFIFDIDDIQIYMNIKDLNAYKGFGYVRIDNAKHINISASTGEFFIGNPISLQFKPGLKKNVVYLFIDGLSSKHLQNNDISKLMPKTYNFFKNGFMGTNVCSAGDWTLASHASMATGLSTQKHKLYHPNLDNKINAKAKLMAEYYNEKGYFTTNIQNNWRITPTYGYYKGFDRILYRPAYSGFDASMVIAEALEALQAFEETNNFLSISFMDLHTVSDNFYDAVSTQTKVSLSDIVAMHQPLFKSINKKYNEHSIITYNKVLKKLDLYLGIIYDYLLANYNDEEITVVLASDHGQSFLDTTEYLLNEYRVLVPFMVRDINAPNIVSDEILQSSDILPIMLKLNDVPLDRIIDGKLPVSFGGESQREFAYTESIFPGQSYKAALTTKTHIYHFETKNTLFDDATIILDGFTAKYINRQTQKDESSLYPEKMHYFEEQVFNHIKNSIILS